MTIPKELEGILVSTPDTLHGALRFAGTRVFAKSLFDYALKGNSIDVFLDHFPDVTREQAEAVLSWEQERLRQDLGYDLTA